mgnify:CR=1 FL=1
MLEALIDKLPIKLRNACRSFMLRSFAEMSREIELQEGVSRAWASEANRAAAVADGEASLAAEKDRLRKEIDILQRKLEYLEEFDDPETAYLKYRKLFDESQSKLAFMRAARRVLYALRQAERVQVDAGTIVRAKLHGIGVRKT